MKRTETTKAPEVITSTQLIPSAITADGIESHFATLIRTGMSCPCDWRTKLPAAVCELQASMEISMSEFRLEMAKLNADPDLSHEDRPAAIHRIRTAAITARASRSIGLVAARVMEAACQAGESAGAVEEIMQDMDQLLKDAAGITKKLQDDQKPAASKETAKRDMLQERLRVIGDAIRLEFGRLTNQELEERLPELAERVGYKGEVSLDGFNQHMKDLEAKIERLNEEIDEINEASPMIGIDERYLLSNKLQEIEALLDPKREKFEAAKEAMAAARGRLEFTKNICAIEVMGILRCYELDLAAEGYRRPDAECPL